MKIAFIGSSLLIDNPAVKTVIEGEFERLSLSVVILVPNRKFNAFIKSLAAKKGVLVDSLEPPKPSWIGHGTISLSKEKCRSLYGYYVSLRAEQVVCFSKKGSEGLAYRPILKYAKAQGIATLEFEF